jgi:hypothetical protein
LVFQAHFFVEIGQGSFGSSGVLNTPVHEEAHTDAAKHAQNPHRIAMSHAAAILIGADIQPLVESTFDAPVEPEVSFVSRNAEGAQGAIGISGGQ